MTRSVAKGGASALADRATPELGAGVQVAGWIWDKVARCSVTARASASADAKAALGFTINHTTNDKTIYSLVSIDAEAADKLGLAATEGNWGIGGEGSASVEMVVATTFNKSRALSLDPPAKLVC